MTHSIIARPVAPAAGAHRDSDSSLPAPSDRPTDRFSWLWLVIGLALLPFSTVHAELPLATWLAPIFVLRFVRTQPARVGIRWYCSSVERRWRLPGETCFRSRLARSLG